MLMIVFDVVGLLLVCASSLSLAYFVWKWNSDGRYTWRAAKYELIHGSTHVYVSGAAGTGKTKLIAELTKKRGGCIVLAPTALAAYTVGGSTIHSFFRFPPKTLLPGTTKPESSVKDLLSNVETIVIDEVSMVRVDVMDAIDRALRRYRSKEEVYGGMRMVFVGDLMQLPPVVTQDDEPALREHYSGNMFYNAPGMHSIPMSFFELKKVHRQPDKKFANVLNKIRHGVQTDSDLGIINSRIVSTQAAASESNVLTVVFRNSNANHINQVALDQLSGDVVVSQTVYEGNATDKSVPCENLLRFKLNARIAFINNDPKKNWCNGTLGEIVAIKDASNVVVLTRSGQEIDVPRIEFPVWEYINRNGVVERVEVGSATQFPFKLAWAITAHKAQGQTFDRVHIDIDDDRAFADGQMYVALSRCRTLADLSISRKIRTPEIMVSKESMEYLNTLRSQQGLCGIGARH